MEMLEWQYLGGENSTDEEKIEEASRRRSSNVVVDSIVNVGVTNVKVTSVRVTNVTNVKLANVRVTICIQCQGQCLQSQYCSPQCSGASEAPATKLCNSLRSGGKHKIWISLNTKVFV